MDRKIALKWARALESGKYKQGQSQLRDENNNFCCLGVLCNLHAQAHPEIAAEQDDPQEYMGEGGLLPQAVVEWAGMNSDHGSFITPVELGDFCEASDVVELNDAHSFDFKKIAAIIRKKSDEM